MIILLGNREIQPTAFSFLRRWLSGHFLEGGLEGGLVGHTTNQLHFDKLNSSCTILF